VVAVSVIALGVLLAAQWKGGPRMLAALALAAGVFHGYAYGESIVGAEPTPLFAYLVGFSLVQLAIAFAAQALVRAATRSDTQVRVGRLLGATAATCGVFLLVRAMGA
jgi:urease accessory protein